MKISIPFLTSYDPPGTSEGSLDPLGLYQIADQLAVQLVPAVRERMLRIRFLSAIAVGSLVTDDLEEPVEYRDATPYLVWEWLIVESIIRTLEDSSAYWGVHGALVGRRAIEQQGYLDARSYLKTPRIFGFHGVYKRLAFHLGIIDINLRAGPNAERLVDAWARGQGYRGIQEAKSVMKKWRGAIRRSMSCRPPKTDSRWGRDEWKELAHAFLPSEIKESEKHILKNLLLSPGERDLGAFPKIWELQKEYSDNEFAEHILHDALEKRAPELAPLLEAIRTYEGFVRRLQDAFDIIRSEATMKDPFGFVVTDIADDPDFLECVRNLHKHFEATYQHLGDISFSQRSRQELFYDRFKVFSEPMDAGAIAINLCSHHESIQQAKSDTGKRPWFDRLGPERISIRYAYRQRRRAIKLDEYLHYYRGVPIRRFFKDLS